jgi:DNA-binding NtrC family response regulator
MRQIFAYLELVSSSPLPILLTGEMGVGKSLIAQAIKNLEGQTNPFIYINVGEMNEEEFSDTLFGHQKGTLVDNLSDKKGKIAEAENGILFLDEIGRLSQESQRKLLHLIQENGYYPRGSNQIKKSNVKIIAATNKDIENDFNFRKDLYYRLSIHAICVPNLNSRLEDIPLLVAHFINKFNREFTVKEIKKISLRLKQQVLSGEIMGNVRELESLIANISYAGIKVLNLMEKNHIANQYSLKFENFPTMDEIKFKAIQQAIEYCNNNKTFAAKKMNISKQTLFNILAKNKS